MKVKIAQSCPNLGNLRDYTVHRILQARILEWITFPFSRGSSQPRDWTQVSQIAGRLFPSWASREAQEDWSGWPVPSPADLPAPGVEPGSPALQVGSLPTELPGEPNRDCTAIKRITKEYYAQLYDNELHKWDENVFQNKIAKTNQTKIIWTAVSIKGLKV